MPLGLYATATTSLVVLLTAAKLTGFGTAASLSWWVVFAPIWFLPTLIISLGLICYALASLVELFE